MVAPVEVPDRPSTLDESSRIPKELQPRSKVFELTTIGDARYALARLRELRRDFDGGMKRSRDGRTSTTRMRRGIDGRRPVLRTGGPSQGEELLAGMSNIQRMRTIRSEIAYLEDLMVRIAAREFEIEEQRHRTYLAGIGQWSERRSVAGRTKRI